MASEFDDIATLSRTADNLLMAIADIVKQITAEGKSLHGEASVMKSMAKERPMMVTQFDCENPDKNISLQQQQIYQRFKQQMIKEGVPFADVTINGKTAIIFDNKYIDVVNKITRNLEMEDNRPKNYRDTNSRGSR